MPPAEPREPSQPSAEEATAELTVALLIPALEEEASLARRLPALLELADEVIVSDGGSRDATVRVAREAGARVVTGSPGRGPQINRAARAAESEVLLVLHADTDLPPGALDAVRRAVEGGAVGGGFLLRFDSPRPIFRLAERLINLRTHLTRRPLGDQAQFLTREAYEAVGGFPDWPLLEDLELMGRLARHGPLALLGRDDPTLRVTTSARRFESLGVPRTVATNWWIWLRHLLGASPEHLARIYRQGPREKSTGLPEAPEGPASQGDSA